MANSIIINAAAHETRVAILENGVVRDFYIERRRSRGVVGNVYKGRVVRVLPGMQAAFVDIGLEKAAFLYVTDVFNDHAPLAGDEDDRGTDRRRRREIPPIEQQLRQGQDVLVQVTKEPIGTKGARVTCHISLPGRHLVFMPTVDHLGISRNIASDAERKRLRNIATEMRPKGGGFIVRTAAEGIPSEYLRQDMEVLINLWNDVLQKAKKRGSRLIHEDLDIVLRATRDLATEDLDSLIVDNRDEYDRIMDFIERVMPRMADRVKFYVGSEPIFDAYGIEDELKRALSRRADLPSGGYLIIEKTEALTSIDVNTGRFVGKRNLEETIVQTNLEAAAEIAYQLKLRSIGGLIIVDFIDMDDTRNRERVHQVFQKFLANDKGRVKIGRISEFGIVEMTRKRTGESLHQSLTEPCPHCDGTGHVMTAESAAFDLVRSLRRDLPTITDHDVRIIVAPPVAQLLEGREKAALRDLELRYNKRIRFQHDNRMHVERFEIIGMTPAAT